jgi:dipeptidase E
MQGMMKNSRIYLSGGGDEQQSFPLDKFFFGELPKDGRFLYIPVALRGSKLYSTAHLWMKKVLKLHKRTDLQFENVTDLSISQYENLENFDAIYIGGGNTWNLMKEINNSTFSKKLIKYLKNGGCVYGGSAGAIILGKNINTQNDENKMNLKDISGLGLLHDYSIACHYKEAEQSDQFRKWAIYHNSPIICLAEEAGLVLKNNSKLCVGAKPCIIYFADGIKKEFQPKEFLT